MKGQENSWLKKTLCTCSKTSYTSNIVNSIPHKVVIYFPEILIGWKKSEKKWVTNFGRHHLDVAWWKYSQLIFDTSLTHAIGFHLCRRKCINCKGFVCLFHIKIEIHGMINYRLWELRPGFLSKSIYV